MFLCTDKLASAMSTNLASQAEAATPTEEVEVEVAGEKKRVKINRDDPLGEGGMGSVFPASLVSPSYGIGGEEEGGGGGGAGAGGGGTGGKGGGGGGGGSGSSSSSSGGLVAKEAKKLEFNSFLLEEASFLRKLGSPRHPNLIALVGVYEPKNDASSSATGTAGAGNTTGAEEGTAAAAEGSSPKDGGLVILLLSPRCQRSLEDLLTKELGSTRLPLEDAAEVFFGLVRAVDVLLDKKLAHRDLSCGNVYVDGSVGSQLLPVLGDLGWCCNTGGGQDSPGDIAGRIGFVSLDNLFGARNQRLADIQSLGLLFLAVLRGGYSILDEDLLEPGEVKSGESAAAREALKKDFSRIIGRPGQEEVQEMHPRFPSVDKMLDKPTVDLDKVVEAEVAGKSHCEKVKLLLKGLLAVKPSSRTLPWAGAEIILPLMSMKRRLALPPFTGQEKKRAEEELGRDRAEALEKSLKQ